MNKKEKVGLSTIFLLGIITIFVSIVRFIYFLQAVFTWDIRKYITPDCSLSHIFLSSGANDYFQSWLLRPSLPRVSSS